MNSTLKIVVVALVAIIITIGVVGAATYLTSPEHVTGTPTASPSPTPTATPTPTPSPTPIVTAVHLTSNNTTPFYIGSTLRLTAQLDQPVAGIIITLYNNGVIVTTNPTAVTDATGKATFDRNPTLPFDYHVVATLP